MESFREAGPAGATFDWEDRAHISIVAFRNPANLFSSCRGLEEAAKSKLFLSTQLIKCKQQADESVDSYMQSFKSLFEHSYMVVGQVLIVDVLESWGLDFKKLVTTTSDNASKIGFTSAVSDTNLIWP